MASVILAGFLFKPVSATGAKAGLVFGLSFYIIMYFILQVDLHFVHIWGIEFLLNVAVMYGVSYFYPRKNMYQNKDVGAVDLTEWKLAKPLATVLVVITILLYILLGSNS